jgi:nitroreductase
MDALAALHTRRSISQLGEPGPDSIQLENILRAGLRANDHARLRPWRFLLIREDARKKLGELFVRIKKQDEPLLTEEEQKKLAAKALRAPLIIVVIARVQTHHKVPDIEQILSAGGSAQLMMVAAHAQGLGAIWRTGSLAYDKRLHRSLGLTPEEKIIGFLYLGHPQQDKPLPEMDTTAFVEEWL